MCVWAVVYQSLAFVLGLLATFVWPFAFPKVLWLWCVGLGAACLSLDASHRTVYLSCLLAFVLGWARMLYAVDVYQSAWVSEVQKDVDVTFQIASLYADHYGRMVGEGVVLQSPKHRFMQRHNLHIIWSDPPKHLMLGQVWQVMGMVLPNDPKPTFTQPNPILRLFAKNNVGRIKLRGSKWAHLQQEAGFWQNMRVVVYKAWQAHSQVPYLGVASALAVGLRGGLDLTTKQLFQTTGTSHLLAISGLHIGLVYRLFSALGAGFWWGWVMRFPYASRFYCTALPGLLAAGVYTLLSGKAWVTLRAYIMLVSIVWAEGRGLARHWASVLSLAVFGLLLWEPSALLSPSFWFSVLAVLLLLLGSHLALSNLRSQWLLWCGLLPITYFYFDGVSLLALVANPLLIPWYSYLVVPLVIAALWVQLLCPSRIESLLSIIGFTISLSVFLLKWLVDHCAWGWWFDGSQLWYAFGILGVGGALLLSCYWRLGLCAVALAYYLWVRPIERPDLSLFVMNVGQGLSVLVETPHHALLYDTGPPGSGRQVVLPLLHKRRWDRLDRVVLSHGDSDHAGGYQTIANAMPIDQVLSGEPLRLKGRTLPCLQGMHWRWDGIDFVMLSPESGSLNQGNHSSCVLSIQKKGYRILLPGDMDQAIEKQLLVHGVMPHQVIIVPHHGSQSASSIDFLRVLDPKWALISSGAYNRFGHPHPTVVARFKALGTHLLNTAVMGSIWMHWDFSENQTVVHVETVIKP